jgi:hypothetical protein
VSNVRPPLLAVLNTSFNAHVANRACKMAAPTLQRKSAQTVYEVDLQLFGRLGFQHTCQLPHEVAEYTAQDGRDSDEEERI